MTDRYPIEVRAEAIRIADRTGAVYEDLPLIEAAVAHRFFMQAIEPIQRAKARMLCSMLAPKRYFVLQGDALLPMEVDAPEAFKHLDELIAYEAARWCLVPDADIPKLGIKPA